MTTVQEIFGDTGFRMLKDSATVERGIALSSSSRRRKFAAFADRTRDAECGSNPANPPTANAEHGVHTVARTRHRRPAAHAWACTHVHAANRNSRRRVDAAQLARGVTSLAFADLSGRLGEVQLLAQLDRQRSGDTSDPATSYAVNRGCLGAALRSPRRLP